MLQNVQTDQIKFVHVLHLTIPRKNLLCHVKKRLPPQKSCRCRWNRHLPGVEHRTGGVSASLYRNEGIMTWHQYIGSARVRTLSLVIIAGLSAILSAQSVKIQGL